MRTITTNPTSEPKPQKLFLDISPSYLINLYHNGSTVQGNALAAAYIGKLITATGEVRDVSKTFGAAPYNLR